MSGSGGKRRSLLVNAIESIGAPSVEQLAADGSAAQTADQGDDSASSSSRPSFLEKRGHALTEIGKTVKRLTIRIKPSECSIWPGNARDYELLDEKRLETLIESIKSENGNRIPVVIRRTPNAEKQYELITGTRRHWAISWLNQNHYPDIELLASLETLDDEGAFRLADIENREREDISPLERALNYKHALQEFYGGNVSQMSERMGIARPTLHSYLLLADLPAEIIPAFASPLDIQTRYANQLNPFLRDDAKRAKLLSAATALADEQAFRLSNDDLPIGGVDVMKRLIAAASVKASDRPKGEFRVGNVVVGKISDTARGLTVTIRPGEWSEDDILSALAVVISNAKCIKKPQ